MSLINLLHSDLNSFIELLIKYALLLAGVSALSMAMLDALKGLLSIKEHYHQYMISQWLREWLAIVYSSELDKEKEVPLEVLKLANLLQVQLNNSCCGISDAAANQILETQVRNITPFTLVPEKAIYAMTTEKLIAKLQLAIEQKLQQGVDQKDWRLLFATLNEQAAIQWYKYTDETDCKKKNDTKENATLAYENLLTTLNYKLDALQIGILYTWGKFNRFASILLGAIILFFILKPHFCHFELAFLSVFGGALAPVAKNMVTTLRGVKKF